MPTRESPTPPENYANYLVDHLPSMLAYWDKNLQCKFANRAYRDWFGVAPEPMLGMTLPALLGPKLFALNEPYVRGALAGKPQAFQRELKDANGNIRLSFANYVPDVVDGEVVGFMVSVTDVSDHMRAESRLVQDKAELAKAYERLAASDAALRRAQQLGGIGSWQWEVQPDETSWSRQLYEIMGLDPALPPPSYADHAKLYEKSSWERLQQAVTDCLEKGRPYQLDLKYIRADGKSGWLEARGEAVRDDDGHVVRLTGTVQEITARYEAESQAMLREVAELATRNKTFFLSRLSHELRTPLNSILGFAQLIENRIDTPPKQKVWAETVLGAGRQMLEMVEELLDLSSAELGEISIRCENVDLRPVVAACLEQASPMAAAGNVSLIEKLPEQTEITVVADPLRIKQVLNNLLSNAIKYNRLGGQASIHAALGPTEVTLSVRDTGNGMTPEQLDKLFIPFERLGAELSPVPGTGIGMALTKQLVELMGGRIVIESEVGVGTTISVLMPRAAQV